MKGFLLIVVSALAVNLCSSSWADDETKFPSPDGKFAMLLTEDQKEAGRVKIELIDVDSRKVVLDLADSGHPHSQHCKLLWSPDSQRFAFMKHTTAAATPRSISGRKFSRRLDP